MTLDERVYTALMRLRQYGRIAIGRIVGSTTAEDGRYKQMLEMEQCRHIYRVELNALTQLLLAKGVCTTVELQAAMLEEAQHLDTSLAKAWPEITVDEDGRSFSMNITMLRERSKREGWPQ